MLLKSQPLNAETSRKFKTNVKTEVDSDKDFEKLGQLLKENLYSWWD